MGIHGNMSSKKRRGISSRKLGKMKRADQKKKNQIVGEIMDPELITEAHLRKRRTSQRANITLSGKKKRKLNNQIKRLQKKNSAMDTEVSSSKPSTSEPREIEMANSTKRVKVKNASQQQQMDIEMKDD